jgi:hypothetical protein
MLLDAAQFYLLWLLSKTNMKISFSSRILLASATAFFVSCAGRAPQPVAVVQFQDKSMNCAAIYAEVESNNKQITALAKEKGLKVGQNVATGVAGLFIPVLWFGMDWQGTQDKEIAALQSRQQYLAILAEQRGCYGKGGR